MKRVNLFRVVAVIGFFIIAVTMIFFIVELAKAIESKAPAETIWKSVFLVILFLSLSVAEPLLFWTVADLLQDKIEKEDYSGLKSKYVVPQGNVVNQNNITKKEEKKNIGNEKNIRWMYEHGVIDEDEKNKRLKELQKQEANTK